MKTKHPLAWLLLAGCLFFAGCNYDFPLTEKPTRQVDARLLGEWVSFDKDQQKLEQMTVRKLDDSTYIVAMDHDIYRVFHSDFADTPFVSVQDLNSDERKYAYYVWELTPDGKQLTVKGVRTRLVPEQTKDRVAIQKLIKENLANPLLYGDALVFTPKKR
jgi:hypothetical protein